MACYARPLCLITLTTGPFYSILSCCPSPIYPHGKHKHTMIVLVGIPHVYMMLMGSKKGGVQSVKGKDAFECSGPRRDSACFRSRYRVTSEYL